MRDRLTITMSASHILALVFVAAAVLFGVLGAITGDSFYLRLLTEALIFAGLGLSADLLLGFSGALSLGQALYFGIGAYVSALTLMSVPSFWAAIGAAGAASLVASFLGGLIANRVRGVYFALITFGMAQVIAKIVYNTRELGASDGLIGVPVIDINFGLFSVSAGSPLGLLLVVLGTMAVLYGICAYLLETPFGRVLTALKANEKRVPFLGYSVWRARMAAYVLAGVIAGISGSLYPLLRGFVSPELMFFSTSGDAIIVVIVGGVGTLIGPFYGTVAMTVLKSVIGSWTEHHLIVIGALFMASVLFLPKGLIGLVRPPLANWLMKTFSGTREKR